MNAFSICERLTNVRPTRILLAISSLLTSLHYGLRSERLPLLAERVHFPGARGILFTAFLPHPGCMSLAAISWLYMLSTTSDYAVTLCSCCVSRFVLEPGLRDLDAQEAYTLALPSSASPAVLFAGDCANLSPFEQSVVHLYISETADIQYSTCAGTSV